MEHTRAARRSFSHGPLVCGASAHPEAFPRLPNPRRPLQSLDANTLFLASPAPLESLLKKTTETGDIGFFSIGSVRSVNASHGLVPPKIPWHPPAKPEAPRVNVEEGPDLTDDRRSLPSYRESTSEIASLYDSGKSTSGTRSSGSHFHLGYRRSYSMTTCSSTSTWMRQSGQSFGRSCQVYPAHARYNDYSEDPDDAFDVLAAAPGPPPISDNIPALRRADVAD